MEGGGVSGVVCRCLIRCSMVRRVRFGMMWRWRGRRFIFRIPGSLPARIGQHQPVLVSPRSVPPVRLLAVLL